jgi:hypothetical protein
MLISLEIKGQTQAGKSPSPPIFLLTLKNTGKARVFCGVPLVLRPESQQSFLGSKCIEVQGKASKGAQKGEQRGEQSQKYVP